MNLLPIERLQEAQLFSQVERGVEWACLAVGALEGIKQADRAIQACTKVMEAQEPDKAGTLPDMALNETLLSAAAIAAALGLVACTSPLVSLAIYNPNVVNRSVAFLAIGFEAGVGLRGLEGLASVAYVTIKDIIATYGIKPQG